MLQTTSIALLLGFWASLYLLDALFKSHHALSQPYLELQANTGVTIGVGQVRWYTTCLNRFFFRLGQIKPRFQRIWFTVGVVFGLVSMVISMFLLTLIVYNTLKKEPVEQQILTPVMPGVNLPASQTGYYLMTLLVCGILHEVGHAVAAVREQVRVNGFGFFVMAIYPGAFVDLKTEHLQAISPLRQLRIYCAGVWHNFVIVMAAIVVLLLLPWLLWPFYTTGAGVVITSVVSNSAVSGPRGLFAGDHVTAINQCPVTSVDQWVQCVSASMSEKPTGYCMPQDLLKQQDISYFSHATPAGGVECCANTSSTHLCFNYHVKAQSDLKSACLPARTTTERQSCVLQSDCYHPSQLSVCVTPALDNSTKLLKVQMRGRPPLLFLGHPVDLHYAVTINNFVPAYGFVLLDLPYVIETFSKYLISLSGALALLNVVPCYALDGQFILQAAIELLLRPLIPNSETRGFLFTLILLFGSVLIVTNILLAIYMLFFS